MIYRGDCSSPSSSHHPNPPALLCQPENQLPQLAQLPAHLFDHPSNLTHLVPQLPHLALGSHERTPVLPTHALGHVHLALHRFHHPPHHVHLHREVTCAVQGVVHHAPRWRPTCVGKPHIAPTPKRSPTFFFPFLLPPLLFKSGRCLLEWGCGGRGTHQRGEVPHAR